MTLSWVAAQLLHDVVSYALSPGPAQHSVAWGLETELRNAPPPDVQIRLRFVCLDVDCSCIYMETQTVTLVVLLVACGHIQTGKSGVIVRNVSISVC